MKKEILLVIFFYMSAFCFSQVPVIEWQKALGGTGHDAANAVIQTRDEGYIMVGYSDVADGDVATNYGYVDAWIVKFSTNGTIEWKKSFGGSLDDFANSIVQTLDGGYVFAGTSLSNDGDVPNNNGDYDFWILKMDSVGTVEWKRSYGGSEHDEAQTVIQTADGGYAVTGRTGSNDGDVIGSHGDRDYWVVKLDSIGSLQWQKPLGGSFDDCAYSIIQTSDRGYAVVGFTNSTNGQVTGLHLGGLHLIKDYWVVKLDSAGVLIWQKTLGGNQEDIGRAIVQTSDSGFIVAGNSYSADGDVTGGYGSSDYWIVKLNSSGAIQWQNSYGGSDPDVANSIVQTNDGGYVVSGASASDDGNVTGSHGGNDYWIIKLNNSGVLQWQKALGGSKNDWPYYITQTNDGGYAVVGSSYSNDGDVTGGHGTSYDCWVVKLGMATSGEELDLGDNKFILSPNPATNWLNVFSGGIEIIELNIYNITGLLVSQTKQLQNESIDISQLPNGVYMATITTKEGSIMRRWVKL